MKVVAVTDDQGNLQESIWLERAETVHRQLRPQLPPDYARRLHEVFAGGGRMAVVVEGDCVASVAIWRIIENTYEGRRLYVDDLVSDEGKRSCGAGKLLLGWLKSKAKSFDCDVLALDSGVQRYRAHRFYFREGLHVSSFSFKKVLNK